MDKTERREWSGERMGYVVAGFVHSWGLLCAF